MISSWLVKVVVGIALLGFAVIELGSPFVARAQADDAAHAVADAAALAFLNRSTTEVMQAECARVAEESSVEVVTCELNEEGRVRAEVVKTAKSFLLHKFEPTKNWYEVRATAESVQAAR